MTRSSAFRDSETPWLTQPQGPTGRVRSQAALGSALARQGIRCTTVERALTDEIVRRGDLREGVVAILMTCAARLTSLRRMRLTWMLDAGFPRPVCNRIVYTTNGDVLGCPDRVAGIDVASVE